MVDPVISAACPVIIRLLVGIRGIEAKLRTNNKVCCRTLRLVKITRDVVEELKQRHPDIVEKKVMREALEGLEKALQGAPEVVRKWGEMSTIRRCMEAKTIATDLQWAWHEISMYVDVVTLGRLTGTAKKHAHLSDVHLRRQVESRHSSTIYASDPNKNKTGTNETDVASRLKVKNGKDNATAAGKKTPRVSLSSDRSAKSTSAKSVIGQDGPSIANKDSSHRSSSGNGADSSKKEKKIKKEGRPNTTGSKNKTEKANIPADRKNRSRASLSYDKSTSSVKSVDEQVHPSIVSKNQMILSTKNMTGGVTSMDVHPTEPWIVMGDMGGRVYIWDYRKKETVMELVNMDPKVYNCIKEKTAKRWFGSVKFITRENWLVVGDCWGYIRVYDYTNTELVTKFKVPGAGQPVALLAVHPTEKYLLSWSADEKNLILWDWSSGDWKTEYKFGLKSTYPVGVLSLKFNPRYSNTFYCVTNDKQLMVGNIKFHSPLTAKQKDVSKADYIFNHADLHLMATLSSSSKGDEIWNLEILETGKSVATLCVDGRRTSLVAGHPTLPIVVTLLDDGTVCFWDANTYKRLEPTGKLTTSDEPADNLTLLPDAKGITRLVVTYKSKIAIMEFSYSVPTAISSGHTGGGNYG